MGGYFSKIGSDPYYANYEKSFQRLRKDIDQLNSQQQSRLQTRNRVGQFVIVWSAVLFVFIALFAAWVLRQPEGTYTPSEHAARVSPLLLEPLSAYALHCSIQWLLKIRDKRLGRRLTTLQTKMKRMVHDLKDSTRYEKTQKLLEKYDPEYVPSSPSRGFSNSMQFGSAITPGIRHRNVSQAQAQGNAGMMSPLAGLQRGVGAAGSRVGPLLNSLAGMVGDNPALMEGLNAAKAEAEKLRSQVEKLQHENQVLRARLGEDVQEQQAVTPRANLQQQRFMESGTGDSSPQQAPTHSDEADLAKANDTAEAASTATVLNTDSNSDSPMRSRDQQTTARKRR